MQKLVCVTVSVSVRADETRVIHVFHVVRSLFPSWSVQPSFPSVIVAQLRSLSLSETLRMSQADFYEQIT